MKKLFLTIFSILSTFFIINNYIQARSASDFTPALDTKVAQMKTTEEKVKFLKSFSDLLAKPRFINNKNSKLYKDIRQYALNMLEVFQQELDNEKILKNETLMVNSNSTVNLPTLSDNFLNINEWKVRNAILSRHNDERASLGVSPYKYNLDLEGSATTRANKLAVSGKTSNLHPRNSGDGYYNYDSLLNRFSGLGIKFPKSVKRASSFSESIGYGYYKCSKSDCTQDLIDSAKKTRTGLIMKEKSYNGSHYRAAVMKHFTQMGAGIAIDKSNNRYYIVLHYGVEF